MGLNYDLGDITDLRRMNNLEKFNKANRNFFVRILALNIGDNLI